jgi:23S rRNA pseudouridine1911/1915/1917 synthase
MLQNVDTFHFVADKGDQRLRLDQVLVRRVTVVSRLSRNIAQQWIESGAVQVDGTVVRRPATHIRIGAHVTVALPGSAPRRVRPAAEDTPLDIVFEDEWLLVLNKPAGVVVHPSYKQTSGTLLNAILGRNRNMATTQHGPQPGAEPGVQPGIVTRLDKDTSGLVLIALSPAIHATLQREVAAGHVEKRYLAVVGAIPSPPSGRIRLPLGRDPQDRRRMIVTSDGAASDTRYQLLSELDVGGRHGALVSCTLITGRTHQIRVHLASQGWPIVGDAVYGIPHAQIARQALHAWQLALTHPITGQTLALEAPVPADITALLSSHGTMPEPRTAGDTEADG